MTNIFVARPAPIGPTYWRRTLPLRHLTRALWARGIAVTYGDTMKRRHRYDVVYINRNLADASLLAGLLEIRDRGTQIVWDMDDDLLHLPPLPSFGCTGHDDRIARVQESALLRACLELADVITTSTEPLRWVCGRPEKTLVCPNLIDLRDYPLCTATAPRDVILYSGSSSHQADVDLIRDLYHETADRFRWVFYGCRPAWLDGRGVYLPWGTVADYPRVCRFLRPLVCLAPLAPSPFNECKSPIKVWESATYGASVLASNTGPYRGHYAAIVPEGEPFTVDHLREVLDRPNIETCQQIARENSWQHCLIGRECWLESFSLLAAHSAAA